MKFFSPQKNLPPYKIKARWWIWQTIFWGILLQIIALIAYSLTTKHDILDFFKTIFKDGVGFLLSIALTATVTIDYILESTAVMPDENNWEKILFIFVPFALITTSAIFYAAIIGGSGHHYDLLFFLQICSILYSIAYAYTAKCLLFMSNEIKGK